MKKKGAVSFSSTINKEVKKLLENFCKARGLNMNHVLEEALMRFLEDEMDNMIIKKRESEKLVEWKKHG